jgi:hypothetical protein
VRAATADFSDAKLPAVRLTRSSCVAQAAESRISEIEVLFLTDDEQRYIEYRARGSMEL